MEVLELGAPETASPHWTGTHTLAAMGFREPKRLKSFENHLSIQVGSYRLWRDSFGERLSHRFLRSLRIGSIP